MLITLEYLAVLSAACFGILLARSKRMDLVGVCAVALIVAFGGGTLRDVLLDRRPLFWIQHEEYTYAVLILAVVGSFVPRIPRRFEALLNVPDALGLGLFSVVGAGAAVQMGTPMLTAALFGVITGTFGGVIADIVVNEVPRLFQPTVPLYASCSFAGCWVYLWLREGILAEDWALWLGVLVVVSLRLVAVQKNLHFPAAPP